LWGLAPGGVALADVGEWPTLTESRDPELQSQLESELASLGMMRVVREERLAVALVELTDPHNPRYAAVNPDLGIYAASLPKIAILLGVFQKAEDQRRAMDSETLDLCTDMIRSSSNPAATELLNRIGFEYLANLLQSKRYALYDRRHDGGLWVGKAYASTTAWKRDPVNNLSHGATVFQVARFYYLLETGRLVSPRASSMMKAILGQPALQHKFVKGLATYHPDSQIFRKSGTWREWHADSAIIERDGRRYIAVAIARSRNGGEWLSRLIVALDDIVFHEPELTARVRHEP
jgi:beta-lactamase class A